MLTEEERTRLVQNIAGHLKDAKEFIQERAVSGRGSDQEVGGAVIW